MRNGNANYTLRNGDANVQALAAGQTVQDKFTFRVTDNNGSEIEVERDVQRARHQ